MVEEDGMKKIVFYSLIIYSLIIYSFIIVCAAYTAGTSSIEDFIHGSYAIPTYRELYEEGKIALSSFEPGVLTNYADYKKIRLVSFDQFEQVLNEFTRLMQSLMKSPQIWHLDKMPKEELFHQHSFAPFCSKTLFKASYFIPF